MTLNRPERNENPPTVAKFIKYPKDATSEFAEWLGELNEKLRVLMEKTPGLVTDQGKPFMYVSSSNQKKGKGASLSHRPVMRAEAPGPSPYQERWKDKDPASFENVKEESPELDPSDILKNY